MRTYKLLVWLTLVLMLAIFGVFGIAQSTSTNFTVQSGGEVVKSLNLSLEDHVLIKFTVVGQTNHTLVFYITCPDGNVMKFGNVGNFKYSFVCDLEGEYKLHFSNLDSTENKLVALDYEVQHYIFGIPQMLFLTVIIVLVCMAAVAAFVLMGKPR